MKIRTAFVVAFAANVVLALVSLAILPSRVAIHFGWGGMANNWAPNYVNTLLFIGIHTLLFCSFYFTPRLLFVFPAKWINLPNKQYWLVPENRSRTQTKISSSMYQFGTALFVFLFVVELLTIQANLTNPLRFNEKLFFTALGLFMLYTVLWCISFVRGFRIPSEKSVGNKSMEAAS